MLPTTVSFFFLSMLGGRVINIDMTYNHLRDAEGCGVQGRDRKAGLFYAVHLERYLERDMVVLRGAEKGRQAKEEESCQDGSINLRQRDDANTHGETFSRFLYPERTLYTVH